MAISEEHLAVQSQIRVGEVRAVLLAISGICPLSTKAVEEIHKACNSVEEISGCRALIVQINGRDGPKSRLRWPGDVDLQLVSQWEKALRRIERLDACTIAVATRHCNGIALEILLTSDYRIGTSDMCVQLSSPGEMMWPGMSVHRLVGRIGLNESRRLLMFGGELSGVVAAVVGILDETVIEPAAVRRAIEEKLKDVTAGGHSLRRQLLLEGSSSTYEDALGMHLAACDRELRQRQKNEDSGVVLGEKDERDFV
jgi:isomerase DpgB